MDALADFQKELRSAALDGWSAAADAEVCNPVPKAGSSSGGASSTKASSDDGSSEVTEGQEEAFKCTGCLRTKVDPGYCGEEVGYG